METDNAAVYRGPSTKIHRNFALFPFLQTSPQGRNRERSKLYMRKEGSEVSDGMTMPISTAPKLQSSISGKVIDSVTWGECRLAV